jgi:hypothetical protein
MRPAWWYLVAAAPMATTWVVGKLYLISESYKYTSGGLRNAFVLSAVYFADFIGFAALGVIFVFIGSSFFPRLHSPIIHQVISAVSLIFYGFWSIFMTAWVTMK